MVLPGDRAAKTAEKAFDLIGVGAIGRVGFPVVDARDNPSQMQAVPMNGLIGKDH